MRPGSSRAGAPDRHRPTAESTTTEQAHNERRTLAQVRAARRANTFQALTWHAERAMADGDPEQARQVLQLREAV